MFFFTNLCDVFIVYKDIGAAWREEIEIPLLDNYVLELYSKVQSLYKMLHAVVRFKLVQKYGSDVIDPTGLIPAHLLGTFLRIFKL